MHNVARLCEMTICDHNTFGKRLGFLGFARILAYSALYDARRRLWWSLLCSVAGRTCSDNLWMHLFSLSNETGTKYWERESVWDLSSTCRMCKRLELQLITQIVEAERPHLTMYRPFTGLNQHIRKRSFLVAAFHPVFPLRTLTDIKVFEVRVLQHD